MTEVVSYCVEMCTRWIHLPRQKSEIFYTLDFSSSSEAVRSISIFGYFRPVLFHRVPNGHMWLLSTGHAASVN